MNKTIPMTKSVLQCLFAVVAVSLYMVVCTCRSRLDQYKLSLVNKAIIVRGVMEYITVQYFVCSNYS